MKIVRLGRSAGAGDFETLTFEEGPWGMNTPYNYRTRSHLQPELRNSHTMKEQIESIRAHLMRLQQTNKPSNHAGLLAQTYRSRISPPHTTMQRATNKRSIYGCYPLVFRLFQYCLYHLIAQFSSLRKARCKVLLNAFELLAVGVHVAETDAFAPILRVYQRWLESNR